MVGLREIGKGVQVRETDTICTSAEGAEVLEITMKSFTSLVRKKQFYDALIAEAQQKAHFEKSLRQYPEGKCNTERIKDIVSSKQIILP